ncbi:MAG: FHA domain-containing protein [Bacteriovoracaceae bacterium]
MYKLVAVGGKIRGQEFVLTEGENIIGRDAGVSISIPIEGISKSHVKVTLNKDQIFVEDLGSRNGTFVNQKIIKKANLKVDDLLAIPNAIFKLVYVKEKKIIVKKVVTKSNASKKDKDDDKVLGFGTMPNTPIGKIIFIFKSKIMPPLFTLLEEYEWKVLFGITLSVFITITIALTIFPVLQDSKKILLYETAKRGAQYADEVSRKNARALERKNLDQVDTSFLDNTEEKIEYELFDLEGRIVRPLAKLNEFLKDDFSIRARDWAIKNKDGGDIVLKDSLSGGEIGIAKAIRAYNHNLGAEETVGIIAIRFSPKALVLEGAQNSRAFLEALITSALVAIVFFGIVYFLTVRPLEELIFQVEQFLKGNIKELKPKFLMGEIKPLINTLNGVFQRLRELQGEGGGDAMNAEEDGPYVTRLLEFLKGTTGPTMVLNSEKVIKGINPTAEELTGIRASLSLDQPLLDVCKNQGLSATIIDLCDQSANASGMSYDGVFEISGKNYKIFITSLIGKDNYAKAFYVTFVLDM